MQLELKEFFIDAIAKRLDPKGRNLHWWKAQLEALNRDPNRKIDRY